MVCKQGTDDLEEAMSERLQELPPPLGRHNNNSRQDGDGEFSFPQDMDTEVVGPSQVSTNMCSLHSQQFSRLCSQAAIHHACLSLLMSLAGAVTEHSGVLHLHVHYSLCFASSAARCVALCACCTAYSRACVFPGFNIFHVCCPFAPASPSRPYNMLM